MSENQGKIQNSFGKLMSNSLLTIPDRNFDDQVMEKVTLAHALKLQRDKSLKLSWFFLIISALLFPGGFLIFVKQAHYSFTPAIDNALKTPVQVFIPAAVIIFAVLILIQIDNLMKLTFRVRSYY
jgi:hypothetical protein